jgi:hypothetical protein
LNKSVGSINNNKKINNEVFHNFSLCGFRHCIRNCFEDFTKLVPVVELKVGMDYSKNDPKVKEAFTGR